ncbi:MAG TPA: formyltransferase family protein, partial [Leptospiraceae bacterium]|nr:formyltransferase family protein [Leptospiraceae bacterium]
ICSFTTMFGTLPKIGRKAVNALGNTEGCIIVLDKSSSPKRVIKLIARGSMSFFLTVKMFLAELFRKDNSISGEFESVRSNNELLVLLEKYRPSVVILFRAGLIINSKVIDSGIPLLNIHCAKVPEYGGLGSISRALTDKAFDQCATMHRVTVKIDEGEVIDTLNYRLDPSVSYSQNEEIAYNAGIELLKKRVKN